MKIKSWPGLIAYYAICIEILVITTQLMGLVS